MAIATKRRTHSVTIDVEYSGEAKIGLEEVQDWLNSCSSEELDKLDMTAARTEWHNHKTLILVDIEYDGEAEITTGNVQDWMDSASQSDLNSLDIANGARGYDNALGLNGTHAQALNDLVRIQDLFDRMDTSEILAKLAA